MVLGIFRSNLHAIIQFMFTTEHVVRYDPRVGSLHTHTHRQSRFPVYLERSPHHLSDWNLNSADTKQDQTMPSRSYTRRLGTEAQSNARMHVAPDAIIDLIRNKEHLTNGALYPCGILKK